MKQNLQPPEKRLNSDTLSVHSIFATIQGEGPFTGVPAIFVRLAGCNLQCPGCDTDYTSGRRDMTTEDIKRLVDSKVIARGGTTKLVVITGGEPFRQRVGKLICHLIDYGYNVQVETNGTMALPDELVIDRAHMSTHTVYERLQRDRKFTVVCSPKAAKVHPSIFERADAWKYVMRAGNCGKDGLPLQALEHRATPHIARPPEGAVVYLQPMDEQDMEANLINRKAVIENCVKHGYIVQLQIHKLLNLE